ncbi:hypothetical protein [Lutimaribacter saemankumensis]|nr:hypothetical protein [Lutimaribacter saemankumensis]
MRHGKVARTEIGQREQKESGGCVAIVDVGIAALCIQRGRLLRN